MAFVESIGSTHDGVVELAVAHPQCVQAEAIAHSSDAFGVQGGGTLLSAQHPEIFQPACALRCAHSALTRAQRSACAAQRGFHCFRAMPASVADSAFDHLFHPPSPAPLHRGSGTR